MCWLVYVLVPLACLSLKGKEEGETSLVVQWLRLCSSNLGGPGSIPGQGTRSRTPQVKNPCAETKTWSVQFSRSVVSDSLWPRESWHTRPPCPSPTPGVYPNPCPLNQWCHPTISSSVVPFSSCPQSLPASGSFPVSQLFAWVGQSIGVSASASALPMNTQDWSPGTAK